MKNILFIFFLVCWTSMNAQYDKATIQFVNNTSKEGFVKIRSYEGVKFKETEDGEVVVYNQNQIIGFDIDGVKYRYVITNNNDIPPILREVIKGKASLYATDMSAGSSSMSFGSGSNLAPLQFQHESRTVYHLLIDNRLYDVGTKLKKRHLKKLNDCPELISQIEKGLQSPKNVVMTIEFYNEQCGSQP